MNHLIKFNETEISAVKIEGDVFVPLKPICEAIGIDWERQRKTINEHPVLKEVPSLQAVPSAGGMQEMLCLPLDFIPGWLFMINANAVNEAAKPMLIAYQRECYKALRDYFFGKPDVIADRSAQILALRKQKQAHESAIKAIKKEIIRLETKQAALPFNQRETLEA